MLAFCYIIHSDLLNRFYVGSTILDPEQRLEKHLSLHYGNQKFTAKADDWELFLSIECDSIDQARKIERHIKRMKSSKYIKDLNQYPEIINKLKEQHRQ